MTDIQLYTGEEGYYSEWQVEELKKPLNPKLISTRKGTSNTTLRYLEGHDAIDQANRVFGFGNWSYRPLSVEQVVLIDPLTGEAVGIEYKAEVEVTVRGSVKPVVDIGSQPVAAWNVEDHIMQRRINDAKYNHKEIDESPFSLIEKKTARAVIVDAHEAAKKGAVTDALKRALRSFGAQFGNSLYGKDRPDYNMWEENTVEAQPQVQPAPQPRAIAAPTQRPQAQQTAQPAQATQTPRPIATAATGQSKPVLDMIAKAKLRVDSLQLLWDDAKRDALEGNFLDSALTVQMVAKINGYCTNIERKQQSKAS